MTRKQFQGNLMLNYKINALQISYSTPDLPLILNGSKKETPCLHSAISIHIDLPLPQDAIQAGSRQSDVELHNKRSPNITFYLTCL